MTFSDCVVHCAMNRDLVREYDRLTGESLGSVVNAPPIARMIDQATGFGEDQMGRFAAFVFETIWSRLPEECFATP